MAKSKMPSLSDLNKLTKEIEKAGYTPITQTSMFVDIHQIINPKGVNKGQIMSLKEVNEMRVKTLGENAVKMSFGQYQSELRKVKTDIINFKTTVNGVTSTYNLSKIEGYESRYTSQANQVFDRVAHEMGVDRNNISFKGLSTQDIKNIFMNANNRIKSADYGSDMFYQLLYEEYLDYVDNYDEHE